MFSLRNKKNIDTFWLEKSALSRAMISLYVNSTIYPVICDVNKKSNGKRKTCVFHYSEY